MHGLIPLKATNGIHSSSSRTPHKVAVRHGDRSVTYKQLTDNMRCVSQAAFTDIRFQGNVAIVGNNSIEYLEVLLGLADVGVPVVTINPKWVAREVIECLKDCKARVLFIDNDLYKEEYGQHCDLIIIFGSKYEEWVKYYKPIEHYPDFKDSAIFNIVYSSGTTNKPKGMLISHRSRSMTSYLMPLDWNCMKEYDDEQLINQGSYLEMLSTEMNHCIGHFELSLREYSDYGLVKEYLNDSFLDYME